MSARQKLIPALALCLALASLAAAAETETGELKAAKQSDVFSLSSTLCPEDFVSALVGQWTSGYVRPDKPSIVSAEFRADGAAVVRVTDEGVEKDLTGRYVVAFPIRPTGTVDTAATIMIQRPGNRVTLARVHFDLHNGVLLSHGMVLRIDDEPYGALLRSSAPTRIIPRVSDLLPKGWCMKEISLNTVPYGLGIGEGQHGGTMISFVGPTVVKGPRALNNENESFSLWVMPARYEPPGTGEAVQFDSARLLGSNDAMTVYAKSFTTGSPSWTTWGDDIAKHLSLTIGGNPSAKATPRSASAAEPAPEWSAEGRDLNAGSYRGSATITVGKSSVTLGEKFAVDIRFFNASNGDYFYNPFFNRLVPLPARLAIYDADHKYRGDLLHRTGGSRKTVSTNDWTYIPSLCYVGFSERFTAGYVPGTAHGTTANLLPPGEYYLHMIYFRSFATTNPARLESNPPVELKDRLLHFEKNFDRTELFRSNTVAIQFTASQQDTPPPQ